MSLRRPFEEGPSFGRRLRNHWRNRVGSRWNSFWMDHDTLALVLTIGTAFLVVCAVVLGGVTAANEVACDQRGEEYGLETDYRFISSRCFATLEDGRVIDIEQIRATTTGRTLPGEE